MMTDDPGASVEEVEAELPALAEMLNLSVLSGVVVIPLILPLPEEEGSPRRALLSKFQVSDSEDKIVYDATVPLDVLGMLSLNFLRACVTAFQNVGGIQDQDMLFAKKEDLRDLIERTKESLDLLQRKFSE